MNAVLFKINETLFNVNEMKMTSLKISSDLIYPFFQCESFFFSSSWHLPLRRQWKILEEQKDRKIILVGRGHHTINLTLYQQTCSFPTDILANFPRFYSTFTLALTAAPFQRKMCRSPGLQELKCFSATTEKLCNGILMVSITFIYITR